MYNIISSLAMRSVYCSFLLYFPFLFIVFHCFFFLLKRSRRKWTRQVVYLGTTGTSPASRRPTYLKARWGPHSWVGPRWVVGPSSGAHPPGTYLPGVVSTHLGSCTHLGAHPPGSYLPWRPNHLGPTHLEAHPPAWGSIFLYSCTS